MFDVLVTGGETRQGVVVIRSLGKRGVKVLAGGEHPTSIGFYSKYVTKSTQLPSPLGEKEQFVNKILDIVKKHNIPYIYPVTETSLIALNDHRQEVDSVAKLLAPSPETVDAAIDKIRTLEIVKELGIDTTETLIPGSVEEAVDTAERWGYPVIFKPRSQSSNLRGDLDFKVYYAHNKGEVVRFLKGFGSGHFPLMQEYAFGPHIQFHCFVENGVDVHSHFQDDMTRMLPLTGGVGARSISVEVVPEIAEMSSRLFTRMNWEGVAQTQWKGPGKDGKFTFIEVSVRIVASIGSLVQCGVDLPWMHYQYFTGQSVDRAEKYIVGRPTRWLRGDTLTMVRYLVNDMQKSGDPLPSKLQVFSGWLYDFIRPGLRYQVLSFSDPLPGLVEFKFLILNLMPIFRRRLSRSLPFLGNVKRVLRRWKAMCCEKSE